MNNFNGPPKIVSGGASYADGKTSEKISQENTERVTEIIKRADNVRIIRSDGTTENNWKAINIIGHKVFVVSENNQTRAILIDDFLKWQDVHQK
ncbi:MAG: hypothetical protein UT78_C0007G0004 [Candidatus Nomurabacteria bacterium GW2011_GWF2_40_12]|uniref:Uncharacterized protein n=1 Tax=Candidatus Nomurabacteria bacterium GW2011_GWF2_40_12 TaxID=1618776 RepID=A0A0G0R093_9BACT|nr:MAG: hypothetical protein UT78_C0007G0004 [Candidatus Nomurabacteria bacterium GW2011_GWF2_40_12]OGJ14147.1 MAG: hypothetical protein A2585_02100 [Candidatus Nomurabacteria bacterium RIFOXYD1_FULL_39_12]